MSHQSNSEEYAKPCIASGGEKTVTEIHDGIYGKYDPKGEDPNPPNNGSNPAEKLNPKPFTMK